MWVALRFAYDGGCFPSYARDPAHPGSVENVLIRELKHVGYVEGSWKTGSRTDAGVSAIENVVAFEVNRPRIDGILPALQARLPQGLWATGVATVDATWNPRYATTRTYQYHCWPKGNLEWAQAATQQFLGTHSMGAFARVDGGRDPVRTVNLFEVHARAGLWQFTVEGPSFLWNQVRRMVGACLTVAEGKAPAADIGAALRSGEQHPHFHRAPAEGLVLARVSYELEWEATLRDHPALRKDIISRRARQSLTDELFALIASA